MEPRSWILGLAAVVTLAVPAPALQGPGDLRVGHWVKVKGQLDARGDFIGSGIELREPEDEEALIGTVTAMKGPTRFLVLGQEVHASARTELRSIDLGDLTGARIKVEGHYRGPRNFAARTLSSRDPGRDAIEGRIDLITRVPGGLDLTIMNFEVHLSSDVVLEVQDDGRPEQFELAPLTVFPTGPDQRIELDDEDKVQLNRRLTDKLYFGGQLEYAAEHRDNYDLNDTRDRNRTDQAASLRAELLWEPSDGFFMLVGGRTAVLWRDEEGAPNETVSATVLSEGYGYWRDVLGTDWDLQFGRQDFDERREWLYDQNLDAVRAIYSRPAWRFELSASTTLSDGSERDESSTNLIAYLSNNDLRRHAAAYVVDRSEYSSEHATHAGVRAHGPWLPQNRSWVEAALVSGESGGRDLLGYGFDLGTTWNPGASWPSSLALTAAYAFGSGDDDPTDGTDGAFRQTGLNDNNDKYGGVTSFHYYGELVDPELSNLSIATVGVGVRPTRRSSIDLVLHKLDQVEAAADLRDTSLRGKPDGLHRDLGWEGDIIYGNRELRSWHLELVVGYFQPGTAFPGADPAWLGRFQLRFRF